MTRYVSVLLASLLFACGGGEKPPETPPPVSPEPTSGPAPKSSGTSAGGPVAPTNSDDVKKGIAALKSGDMPGAKAAFDSAIAKNPKQADAYHYRGVVEDQTGRRAAFAEKASRDVILGGTRPIVRHAHQRSCPGAARPRQARVATAPVAVEWQAS